MAGRGARRPRQAVDQSHGGAGRRTHAGSFCLAHLKGTIMAPPNGKMADEFPPFHRTMIFSSYPSCAAGRTSSRLNSKTRTNSVPKQVLQRDKQHRKAKRGMLCILAKSEIAIRLRLLIP